MNQREDKIIFIAGYNFSIPSLRKFVVQISCAARRLFVVALHIGAVKMPKDKLNSVENCLKNLIENDIFWKNFG